MIIAGLEAVSRITRTSRALSFTQRIITTGTISWRLDLSFYLPKKSDRRGRAPQADQARHRQAHRRHARHDPPDHPPRRPRPRGAQAPPPRPARPAQLASQRGSVRAVLGARDVAHVSPPTARARASHETLAAAAADCGRVLVAVVAGLCRPAPEQAIAARVRRRPARAQACAASPLRSALRKCARTCGYLALLKTMLCTPAGFEHPLRVRGAVVGRSGDGEPPPLAGAVDARAGQGLTEACHHRPGRGYRQHAGPRPETSSPRTSRPKPGLRRPAGPPRRASRAPLRVGQPGRE